MYIKICFPLNYSIDFVHYQCFTLYNMFPNFNFYLNKYF